MHGITEPADSEMRPASLVGTVRSRQRRGYKRNNKKMLGIKRDTRLKLHQNAMNVHSSRSYTPKGRECQEN